jgi:lipopolysaccharide export LptBFGC system permease protein LptF
MPESPEIETEKLREEIHEEMEKQGGAMLRGIALSTALLAAFAAVASLKAGDAVNEGLVLKTEATRLQAEASDQWAFYQAKGIKRALQEASETPWRAAQKSPPPEFAAQAKRYADEQAGIERTARVLERERDARSKQADALLERHHRFANAVALLQVSIALGAVAALTRRRVIWLGSILIGLVGLLFFSLPFLS